MSELRNQSVLVLGLGESGLAMACWAARQRARVRVADTRAAPPGSDALRRAAAAAQLVTGPFAEPLLADVDIVALSPGLSLAEPLVQRARARGLPVVGEIELFARALRELGWRTGAKVIAITGTNGKTTVTTLVGEMGRAAGLDTVVAGNISPAALDALRERVDAGRAPQLWVLELSSFQLETTQSLDADAAVVLNVSDDHLDRYRGVEDYAAAKTRIFAGGGVQVLNRQDARVAAMALPGRPVLSFGLDAPTGDHDYGIVEASGEPWLARGRARLIAQREVLLAGRHNVANALAALALADAAGLPQQAAVEALTRFRGLPHRVERVAEIGGVRYYDDSKGTNVGATLAALEGMGAKVVLIAGGDGKGQDFSPLEGAVARHARAVVLIGRDAARIHAAIAPSGVPLEQAADMDDAVRRASRAARPGDVVLLSPACASFDMFRDYAHRAQVFVQAVHALAKGCEVDE